PRSRLGPGTGPASAAASAARPCAGRSAGSWAGSASSGGAAGSIAGTTGICGITVGSTSGTWTAVAAGVADWSMRGPWVRRGFSRRTNLHLRTPRTPEPRPGPPPPRPDIYRDFPADGAAVTPARPSSDQVVAPRVQLLQRHPVRNTPASNDHSPSPPAADLAGTLRQN